MQVDGKASAIEVSPEGSVFYIRFCEKRLRKTAAGYVFLGQSSIDPAVAAAQPGQLEPLDAMALDSISNYLADMPGISKLARARAEGSEAPLLEALSPNEIKILDALGPALPLSSSTEGRFQLGPASIFANSIDVLWGPPREGDASKGVPGYWMPPPIPLVDPDGRLHIDNYEIPGYTRLGYVSLTLPPNALQVRIDGGVESSLTLRSRGPTQRLETARNIRVSISTLFVGQAINKELLPIIRQLERTPFIPVANEHLYFSFGIDALAVQSYTVSTVPGMVDALSFELEAVPFIWSVYLPQESSLDDAYCWPLYQLWCELEGKNCKPIENGVFSGRLSFTPVSEAWLESAGIRGVEDELGQPRDKALLRYAYIWLLGDMAEGENATERDRIYSMYGVEKPPSDVPVAFNDLVVWEEGSEESQNWSYSATEGPIAPQVGPPRLSGRWPLALVGNLHRDTVLKLLKAILKEKQENWHMLANVVRRAAFGEQALTRGEIEGIVRSLEKGEPVDMSPAAQGAEAAPLVLWFCFDSWHRRILKEVYETLPTLSFSKERILKQLDAGRFDEKERTSLDGVVINGISVSAVNMLSELSVSQQLEPVQQYLGKGPRIVNIQAVCGEGEVAQLKNLFDGAMEQAQKYAARYLPTLGMDAVAGFLRVENEICNLVGIHSVFPISISVDTIEGAPGAFSVSMSMAAFEPEEKVRRSVISLNEGVLFSRPEMIETALDKVSQRAVRFEFWEYLLRQQELYPDMKLPMWDNEDPRYSLRKWIRACHEGKVKELFGLSDWGYRPEHFRPLAAWASEDAKSSPADSKSGASASQRVVYVGGLKEPPKGAHGFVEPDFYCASNAKVGREFVDGILAELLTAEGGAAAAMTVSGIDGSIGKVRFGRGLEVDEAALGVDAALPEDALQGVGFVGDVSGEKMTPGEFKPVSPRSSSKRVPGTGRFKWDVQAASTYVALQDIAALKARNPQLSECKLVYDNYFRFVDPAVTYAEFEKGWNKARAEYLPVDEQKAIRMIVSAGNKLAPPDKQVPEHWLVAIRFIANGPANLEFGLDWSALGLSTGVQLEGRDSKKGSSADAGKARALRQRKAQITARAEALLASLDAQAASERSSLGVGAAAGASGLDSRLAELGNAIYKDRFVRHDDVAQEKLPSAEKSSEIAAASFRAEMALRLQCTLQAAPSRLGISLKPFRKADGALDWDAALAHAANPSADDLAVIGLSEKLAADRKSDFWKYWRSYLRSPDFCHALSYQVKPFTGNDWAHTLLLQVLEKDAQQGVGAGSWKRSAAAAGAASEQGDRALKIQYGVEPEPPEGIEGVLDAPPSELREPEKLFANPDTGNDAFTDLRANWHIGRLVSAFPTFYVSLIDGGRWYRYYKPWDHWYGLFGINEVEVHWSRNAPASVCTLVVNNLFGNLTNRMAEFEWESLRNLSRQSIGSVINAYITRLDELITGTSATLWSLWSQHMASLFLKPGARLHVRMGYGSNASLLPIAFNGAIVEVPVDAPTLKIVALGDGWELEKEFSPNASWFGKQVYRTTGWFGQGRNPRNLILEVLMPFKLLSQLVDVAMGKLTGLHLLTIGANPFGIEHFGNRTFLGVVGQDSGEVGISIYNPTLSRPYSRRYGDMFQLFELWNSAESKTMLGVQLERGTAWEVFKTAQRATPEYIVSPCPFGWEHRLFFGKPWFPFFYKYKSRNLLNLKFGDPAGTVDIDARSLNEYFSWKPFCQVHIITSQANLLENRIEASEDGMYNQVQAIGAHIGTLSTNGPTASNVMCADTDIFPEHRRQTKVISGLLTTNIQKIEDLASQAVEAAAINGAIGAFGGGIPGAVIGAAVGGFGTMGKALFFSRNILNSYAIQTLVEFMKDMYKGRITVLGDCSIKPYDLAYLSDDYNDMHGVIGVKGVTHRFGLRTGFVTDVQPDACVTSMDDVFTVWWCSLLMAGSAIVSALVLRRLLSGWVQRRLLHSLSAAVDRCAFWLIRRYGVDPAAEAAEAAGDVEAAAGDVEAAVTEAEEGPVEAETPAESSAQVGAEASGSAEAAGAAAEGEAGAAAEGEAVAASRSRLRASAAAMRRSAREAFRWLKAIGRELKRVLLSPRRANISRFWQWLGEHVQNTRGVRASRNLLELGASAAEATEEAGGVVRRLLDLLKFVGKWILRGALGLGKTLVVGGVAGGRAAVGAAVSAGRRVYSSVEWERLAGMWTPETHVLSNLDLAYAMLLEGGRIPPALAGVYRVLRVGIRHAGGLLAIIGVESVIEWFQRKTQSRQACMVMPLTVSGVEFSAGINGHMGLVVGDNASLMDRFWGAFSPIKTAAMQARQKLLANVSHVTEAVNNRLHGFSATPGAEAAGASAPTSAYPPITVPPDKPFKTLPPARPGPGGSLAPADPAALGLPVPGASGKKTKLAGADPSTLTKKNKAHGTGSSNPSKPTPPSKVEPAAPPPDVIPPEPASTSELGVGAGGGGAAESSDFALGASGEVSTAAVDRTSLPDVAPEPLSDDSLEAAGIGPGSVEASEAGYSVSSEYPGSYSVVDERGVDIVLAVNERDGGSEVELGSAFDPAQLLPAEQVKNQPVLMSGFGQPLPRGVESGGGLEAGFGGGGKLSGKPADFVRWARPYAEAAESAYKIPADVLIAIAALETGWGSSLPPGSNNYFGVKYHGGAGGRVVVPTHEYRGGKLVPERAAFQAYGSPQESFMDAARLLRTGAPYRDARRFLDSGDIEGFVRAFSLPYAGGNPSYAGKILDIMRRLR